MPPTESIEQEFRGKVCQDIRLMAEGEGRYRVFTPFQFDDGDHLAIVLKRNHQGWLLTDEGHTFMHLSYEVDMCAVETGNRAEIVNKALSLYCVEEREGELVLPVREDHYGDALFSFVQALLRISDVALLSRERVRSTFLGDFRAFLETSFPGRTSFEWHDRVNDSKGEYTVDCRINGAPRPVFAYALQNDTNVRDAQIALLTFEKRNVPFRSLGIFEEQETINRRVLAKFTTVCERQFPNLSNETKPRIIDYVETSLA